MEIWKEIIGFENYFVSSLGKVKNLKGSILSFGISKGYQKVGLYSNNKRTNLYIHRLVAKAFIDNSENKPEVNHINGIKTDNRVGNLEWCTSSENKVHAYDNGLSQPIKGEFNGKSKLSKEDVLEIRKKYNAGSITQRELSLRYKVSQCMINNIINHINWNHL